jgi:hypothetical protein
VRSEPHQFQSIGAGFAIDENQVGLDVTIATVVPFAAEAWSLLRSGNPASAASDATTAIKASSSFLQNCRDLPDLSRL